MVMSKKKMEEIRERITKKKFKVRKNAFWKDPKPITKKDKLVESVRKGEIET